MRILIAVPTYENIMPDTFKSIYDLKNGDHEVSFNFVRGYDCAQARNCISRLALDGAYDYVFMVDNDITLPSDALLNLLETPTDVCLGYYASRNADNLYSGKLALFRLGESDYTQEYPGIELKALRERGICRIKVHGGGMGCALIKTDVLRQLSAPWFKYVTYDNGAVLSEDLYFCEKCNNAGIDIYADTRVACGHLFRHVQWTE